MMTTPTTVCGRRTYVLLVKMFLCLSVVCKRHKKLLKLGQVEPLELRRTNHTLADRKHTLYSLNHLPILEIERVCWKTIKRDGTRTCKNYRGTSLNLSKRWSLKI
jgi:hypothetical protein